MLSSRISSVLALVGANVDVRVKSVVVFPGAKPVYKAELESAEVVKALLSGHSQYTRRRDPVARPQGLENVFLYTCVTPGTRIRISLLRVSFCLTTFCGLILGVCLLNSWFGFFRGATMCLSIDLSL